MRVGVVSYVVGLYFTYLVFFFQAEDGIRDLVRSRGLGDVYKRQVLEITDPEVLLPIRNLHSLVGAVEDTLVLVVLVSVSYTHLTLPTSDLV